MNTTLLHKVWNFQCIFNSDFHTLEPCLRAHMPPLDEFLGSSENGLSVHLDVWDETKCPTSSIVVEQRWWFQNEQNETNL